MKVRNVQIESIVQHIQKFESPIPEPGQVNILVPLDSTLAPGMIEVIACGVNEEGQIVRFQVMAGDSRTSPPLHEFLDAFSKMLEETDQKYFKD